METSIIADFREALKRYRFWLLFGLGDATQSFQRTHLGGLFLTVHALLRILIMYFLFRDGIGSGDPHYFGYVALGLPLFSFYSSAVTQGYSILARNKTIIQNIRMPLFAYIFRFLVEQSYRFSFAIIIFAFYAAYNYDVFFSQFHLLLIGVVIAFLLILSISVFCMIISAFFPNLYEGLNALMGVMFFATPVFWHPGDRSGVRGFLANYNPFSHMLAVVREPALGRVPDMISIVVCIGIILLVGATAYVLLRISRSWLIYRL